MTSQQLLRILHSMFDLGGRHYGRRYRVVVAGGGVAGLEAILALRALAEDRTEIDLLTPHREFVYRPLAVAQPFEMAKPVSFELSEICQAEDVVHHVDALVSVNGERKRVRTSSGLSLGFDSLVVAIGTKPSKALAGAVTFSGEPDVDSLQQVLSEIKGGAAKKVVFTLVGGRASWSLPLYELAMLTAQQVKQSGIKGIELAIVTPEDRPLDIFGRLASEHVQKLLEDQAIGIHTGKYPISFKQRTLKLTPNAQLEADRVVALARLKAPSVPGIPRDARGFVPTDRHSRVVGLRGVYAAGDVTHFPIKQGGIATQQADAAAETIAAEAGALVTPTPFKPVLRSLLLTGEVPRYLREEVTGGSGEASVADVEPLWWPPVKIVGRYLAPFLAAHAGVSSDELSMRSDDIKPGSDHARSLSGS